MLKKSFIFIFLMIMNILDGHAGEIVYDNTRFDKIYNQAEFFLKKGNYEEAKKRMYLYLDETHFKSCDGLKLLVDFNDELKLKDKEIYKIIYNACVVFKSGDYRGSLKELKKVTIDDYKDNILLFNIYSLNYYSNIETTHDINNNYKEVLVYLNNTTFLSQEFPLTYGMWSCYIYYQTNQVDLYNKIYNQYLLNNDYLYKIMYDYYFIKLNGVTEVKPLLNVLKYQNFSSRNLTEDQFNIHKSIYKILLDKYISLDDRDNIVKYLFLFHEVNDDFGKLYSTELLNYFLKAPDISIYKSAILNNVASLSYKEATQEKKFPIKKRLSMYYDFISSFVLLHQFNEKSDIFDISLQSDLIGKPLNIVSNTYSGILNNNEADKIDSDMKDLLIKSTKKIIGLHQNGEIKILINLSSVLKTIIKNIPELKEYSSYDFTLNKIDTTQSLNIKKSDGNNNYIIIFIIISIVLLFIVIFFLKKRS